MSRRQSSTKVRRDCFLYWKIETGDGRIHLPCKGKSCNGRLINTAAEKWEADHHIVHEHGGSDDPPNVRPLCIPCHKEKTGEVDIPAIAKARRQADRIFGIRRPKGFKRPKDTKFNWERGRYEKT